ncbi:UNVERIFIED_CONTAM: hypothetical protein FKN15_044306 [Acipenser sinensis]
MRCCSTLTVWESTKELVCMLPKRPPPVCKPAANWHPRLQQPPKLAQPAAPAARDGVQNWPIAVRCRDYNRAYLFREPPGVLPGMIVTSVTDPEDAAVVSQEVAALLQKQDIRMIVPLQLEEGFYSRRRDMDRNTLAELLEALDSRWDAEERRREQHYTAVIERVGLAFSTAPAPTGTPAMLAPKARAMKMMTEDDCHKDGQNGLRQTRKGIHNKDGDGDELSTMAALSV